MSVDMPLKKKNKPKECLGESVAHWCIILLLSADLITIWKTWNHPTIFKLFLLHRNTWYRITGQTNDWRVFKSIIKKFNRILKIDITNQPFTIESNFRIK